MKMDDLLMSVIKLALFVIFVFVLSKTKFGKNIKKRLFNNENTK